MRCRARSPAGVPTDIDQLALPRVFHLLPTYLRSTSVLDIPEVSGPSHDACLDLNVARLEGAHSYNNEQRVRPAYELVKGTRGKEKGQLEALGLKVGDDERKPHPPHRRSQHLIAQVLPSLLIH